MLHEPAHDETAQSPGRVLTAWKIKRGWAVRRRDSLVLADPQHPLGAALLRQVAGDALRRWRS